MIKKVSKFIIENAYIIETTMGYNELSEAVDNYWRSEYECELREFLERYCPNEIISLKMYDR